MPIEENEITKQILQKSDSLFDTIPKQYIFFLLATTKPQYNIQYRKA